MANKKATEIGQIYSKHGRIKRVKHTKKRVLFFIFVGLIALFFVFGFTAQYIFGKDAWVTGIAKETIADAVNVVRVFENSLPILFSSLSAVFIGLVIVWILLTFVRAFSYGSNRRKTVCGLICSFIKYIGAAVIFMVLLGIWGVNTVALVAGVGVLGLVIGLGAQALISDILAGLFIVFEDNFRVGDIVTIDDFMGEIYEIGIRTTIIKSWVGDLKIINNSKIVKLINMSRLDSVAVCDVVIGYNENLEKAERLIAELLPKLVIKFSTILEMPTYMGVAEFSTRGLVLRLNARCKEADRPQLVRNINHELKLMFDRNDINIAVPQVEVKGEIQQEGKSKANKAKKK